MALIQWIQAIVPPSVVACLAPFIIIACFLLAFGDWLYPKWRAAGFAYALSIVTFPLASQVAQLGAADSALVSGIFVPAISGFIWLLHSVLRTLNVPAGGRLGSGRFGNSKSCNGRSGHDRSGNSWRRVNVWSRGGRAVLGGCVGGVLGFALGMVFSLMLLAALSLLAVLPPNLTDPNPYIAAAVLDASIYTFGGLGAGVGILVGSKFLHLGSLIEKGLISAVIYSAVITNGLKTLLNIPLLRWVWQRIHTAQSITKSATATALQRRLNSFSINSRLASGRSRSKGTSAGRVEEGGERYSQGFEVTECNNRLILRCRVYRSADWVWMGFNGLYVLFALLVGAIALLRGTWLTLGLGISFIELIGVLWTWYSLTRLLNYTTLTLTCSHLTRRDAPLPSFVFPICLPLQHIAVIQAVTRSRRSIGEPLSAVPEYCVCAELLDGKRIYLLRHLERWEEAVFVTEQINEFRYQSHI